MEKNLFSNQEKKILEELTIPFAVYKLIDKKVKTLILSNGFCELFGYTNKEFAYYEMDNNMYNHTHQEDKARIENAAIRFALDDDKYDELYRTKPINDSHYKLIHAYGKHVYKDGERLAYIWYNDEGYYIDDDEDLEFNLLNKRFNNEIKSENITRVTRFDYLTGLPNTAYFFELAEVGKHVILKNGDKPVMLYFDMCGLQYFNNKFGFNQGDMLLQRFAKLISSYFGHENCGHLGQDHFGVFTAERGLIDKLEELFKVLETVDEYNKTEYLPVRVGIYHDDNSDTVPASAACDRAKLACDSLGNLYESSYCCYKKELRDEELKKQYIIQNFEKALDEKWIQVYYQSIIRSVSGKVCDDEALSRWIDPVKGFLSPADFIPVLEDAKLIYKLDLYVLDCVIEKIKTLTEKGIFVVPQSINLSRSDFDACDIVEEIRKRVDDNNISHDKITIEITESVIGKDFEFIKTQVERFQQLGFSVWMDDFGSGYSSLDVLQSIKFNLIKFDMGFMRKLHEGERGKVILTELMKLASALDLDTICEGVETLDQVKFLKEIGCSKLQGYYYSKPIPFDKYLERIEKDDDFEIEKSDEVAYYNQVGKVNLYDLAVVANNDEHDQESFQNFFNMIPMGIIELRGDETRFVRSNKSYREFIKRFVNLDLSSEGTEFTKFGDPFMLNVFNMVCSNGTKTFYDEYMPDGSIVHSFARKVAYNEASNTYAIAVAVLSITNTNEGTTYANIARALAADYYNIYYIDLETDKFIEYSSTVGGDEIVLERHGEDFFEECKKASHRIYEEDRETFFDAFSKEQILKEIEDHGVFTTTYRLVDTGKPMYVNMKVTKMQPDNNHIIMGISIIDAQMRHREEIEKTKYENIIFSRIVALSGDYYALYNVDIATNKYIAYSTTDEYNTLGFATSGEDFFEKGIIDGKKSILEEDLPKYLNYFTKENVLNDIREKGLFKLKYHLVIGGEAKPVMLRAAIVKESDGEKMIVGVNMLKNDEQ